MKELYKDTYIYMACKELNINLKDLAYKMNKTLKCIENWRKDESAIPAREKEYINLLIQNEKLKNEIRSFEKHKVTLFYNVESNEFGSCELNFRLDDGILKRLKQYKIILEEV